LSKREYIYRELFTKTNKTIFLPSYLTANPKNPIISEVKAAFLFNDIVLKQNEVTANLDLYHSSLKVNFIKKVETYFKGLNSFNHQFNSILNVFTTKSNTHDVLLKNQYRPMRKGISNMIRLHATGAMALPVEIRIQMLASSKDVIHS
jgi:hypothetical protein